MLAVLCPGQGAQSPQFLQPWLELPVFADELRRLSTRAYVDLAALGTDPDADVVDTAVAQPLIVGAGLASARLLGPLPSSVVYVGHSVGELTAGALAGAYSAAAAVDIARERGRAMARATSEVGSGMAALLGGDADAVTAAVHDAGCWVANHNAAGQLVAAGEHAALERLPELLPNGVRVRRLDVAGAFHTPLMDSAREHVAGYLADLRPEPLRNAVVANGDGAVVSVGDDLLGRIADQVTRPVRFDLCLRTLRDLGVTATVEVAPGGVLTNLVRRELPGVQTVALRSPDDLAAAHDVIDAHATHGEQWVETWRLVVSPVTGTLHREPAAVVRNGNRDVPVQHDSDDHIVEWLAADGDPVREGQPLARVLTAAT